ncbi:hypothetical protein CU669_07375 [Paramagnetospirillum kuznetsovii]|uniref:DUF6898 domain-containing protein n=1 Tax=Paramagnetospirillum kuznetsovii TaxID=2053833 RepID=A0A364NZL3_9PROT|nr:hypothetical protein [Paramagnetospirillum kuznetsovii]RAU22506.1 hypothetical protein CU669_07375 [Paramagnetospirillum kuznetsovii]
MALNGEVLFEFRQIGNSVKVTAFHCDSLTEISVVGPVSAGETRLKQLALRKLDYVLAKNGGVKRSEER